MASCATTGCGNPDCQVCTVSARFVIVACVGTAEGKPCRMVKNHPGRCQASMRAGKTERAELKESKPVPDLSGPRAAATALGFQKRKREGAVRQQRA